MMVTYASAPATLSVSPPAAGALATCPTPPAHFGHVAPSAICVPQVGQKATGASFERRKGKLSERSPGRNGGQALWRSTDFFVFLRAEGGAIGPIRISNRFVTSCRLVTPRLS